MNKTIVKNYQFTVNIYISTVPCLEIITSTVLFNVRKTWILLKTVKTTLRDDCNSHGAIWFSIRQHVEPIHNHRSSSGYRFTKGLPQNLNLRTNLKLEYYIKPLIYIQLQFSSLLPILLNYVFYFFGRDQWFKSY